MRFLKVGTDEEVKIPNVGPADHRSIVTPDIYLLLPCRRSGPHPRFCPIIRSAQMKRRAERFPVARGPDARRRHTRSSRFLQVRPRQFLLDGVGIVRAGIPGRTGAEQKNAVEQRLRISKADGPGGRWFRDQMGFTNPGGPTLWITTFWSPQAGYLPVSMVRSFETPDGKLESKIEWQWKLIDGVYIPSTIKESAYRRPAAGSPGSKRRGSRNARSINRSAPISSTNGASDYSTATWSSTTSSASPISSRVVSP